MNLTVSALVQTINADVTGQLIRTGPGKHTLPRCEVLVDKLPSESVRGSCFHVQTVPPPTSAFQRTESSGSSQDSIFYWGIIIFS